ncbi:hypothetical protein ACHQM5_001584 [Ranunculus cassubicifolius]
MSVGWGHGANMLTKYLAEVSEKTPLTAATCIDSPFDLEEATRSFPYHVALDQKLTSGLIDILQSNKELFQGRAKGFNVEKALSATSLRDFEREISMVSYGFESIEAFYSKSSTRDLVGNVKIPLLFIQSDDGTVPPFSIPRGAISENPFTSLLLCSHLTSGKNINERSVLPWCHHVAVEWLTAVELGFLKGRHPLLKDVDVTINPSAGMALVESREYSDVNKILNVTEINASHGYHLDQVGYDTKNGRVSVSQLNDSENERASVSPFKGTGENVEDSGSDDRRLVSETAENPAENDKSQALQSAEAVMKMLDSTMPGALKEEQKRKVLTAVANGETIMKALEGAVPEDVRGKLTGAVSEIVKNRATNLNFQGVMNVLPSSNTSSVVTSKIQETFSDLSSAVVGTDDVRSQEQLEDEIPGSTERKETAVEKGLQELDTDIIPSHTPANVLDQGQVQSGSSETKETKESNQLQDQEEVLSQKDAKSPGYDENDSELNKHNRPEKAKELTDDEKEKVIAEVDKTKMSSKEDEGIQMKEDRSMDVSGDQNKSSSTSKMDENISQVTSSQPQPLEEESNPSSSEVEDKSIQTVEDEIRQVPTTSEEPEPAFAPTSISSSFNVSQALDALTGFDDSTQVAVNSVFGVLENMIAKLEEDTGRENNGKPNEVKDEQNASGKTEKMLRNGQTNESALSVDSNQVQRGNPVCTDPDSTAGPRWNVPNGKDVKHLTQSNYTSVEGKNGRSSGNGFVNRVNGEKKKVNDMIDSAISEKPSAAVGSIYKLPQLVTVNPYGDSMYNEYLRRYLLSKIPNTKSLDLDSTADLLLDYFPEEGQWMLLDQTEDNGDSDRESESYESTNREVEVIDSSDESDTTEIIETSYVVLDSGKEQRPIEEYKTEASQTKKPDDKAHESELVCLVKSIILESLNVEVSRRLGVSDREEMDPNLVLELENVSKVVSLAVGHRKELRSSEKESTLGEVGPFHGDNIVQAVTLAVNDSVLLKRVLPVGVIVGSSLAALKKHFSVTTQHDNGYSKGILLDPSSIVEKKVEKKHEDQASDSRNDHKVVSRYSDNHTSVKAFEQPETENNNDVVVGAVTAALGASAFLASQQGNVPDNRDGSVDISSGPMSENGGHPKEQDDISDDVDEKDRNPVSSLAEKAMSVAGPVVPTKSEGGIDQEKLVAMLSDLGQKGGMLRMLGKFALLWGGIRGAMSLTDRLISFLHIADRPLFQRILGFAFMALVLWSPVVIPLFPTLVQGWATHNSSGIAEYACVIGLYTAVTILVILWGKRIRGYNSPLHQYGLDLTSKEKLLDFLKGLAGGVMLVLSIHSINTLLGCAHFSWSSGLHTSFPNATETLKAFGKMLLLAGQGIVTATVVVIVEELLFRSWLPEEISVDYGYNRAVIISGFAFSILQRSARSIPGLWLLSIALAGLKQRNEGSLSIPIGMRAGILFSSFIVRTSRYITYHSGYPLWLAGAKPMQPFDGVVGLLFCVVLAVVLYPRQPRAAKDIVG